MPPPSAIVVGFVATSMEEWVPTRDVLALGTTVPSPRRLEIGGFDTPWGCLGRQSSPMLAHQHELFRAAPTPWPLGFLCSSPLSPTERDRPRLPSRPRLDLPTCAGPCPLPPAPGQARSEPSCETGSPGDDALVLACLSCPDGNPTPQRPSPAPPLCALAVPARDPAPFTCNAINFDSNPHQLFQLKIYATTQSPMATWFDDGDPAEQPVEDPPVVIHVPFPSVGGGTSEYCRGGADPAISSGRSRCVLDSLEKNSRSSTAAWLENSNPADQSEEDPPVVISVPLPCRGRACSNLNSCSGATKYPGE